MKVFLNGDVSVNAMSSYLHNVSGMNSNNEMIYATTLDSFIFFYGSKSKVFSVGAFREKVKFLYGLKYEEVTELLKMSVNKCRSVLASKTRVLGKKLIVANIETFKHTIVDPKFFVVEKGDVSSDPVNSKRAGFSAKIDGKEEVFGLDTKMSDFRLDYYSDSSKFCFMKELSKKGFEESQILAYMFRHLDAVALYEYLEKGKFI